MKRAGWSRLAVCGSVFGVCWGFAPLSAVGQTTVFSDSFDDGTPGGVVSGADWTVVSGKVYSYPLQQLIGSPEGHLKNHTPSTDGQMGDPSIGGAVFEVDNNPYAYASYHLFDPQTGDLRLSAWVWDDVESRKPQAWPNPAAINGGVMLASLPSDLPIVLDSGSTEIYAYDDFAFIGIQALVPSSKLDPNAPDFDPYSPDSVAVQYCYQWRTKTDGWHLTLDPNTGNPVPRRVDFRVPEQIAQTWRHVEIVIHPYSGAVGDIEFFIDGALVGQGRRAPGANCRGVDFSRVQIGARFPEETDRQGPPVWIYGPPYSYEHLWFDDVLLTNEPAAGLPCANPQLRFDADDDGDVDQADFAVFQACLTGTGDPAGVYDCLACRCMNSDGDLDIDSDDYAAFELCASGPGIPADATCDDGLPYP